MTFNEFKTWLTKLVEDKKGALPNLADWTKIKENLDQVKPDVINTNEWDLVIDEPCDYDGLCFLEPDKKFFDDLEYLLNKVEGITPVLSWYYDPLIGHEIEASFNGTKINLDNTYEAKSTESNLNDTCSGI